MASAKHQIELEETDAIANRKRSTRFSWNHITKNNAVCAVYLIDFQQVFPYKSLDFRKHRHSDYEMIVPMNQYHCLLNDEDIEANSNEALIIQPGDTHSDHMSSLEPFYCLHFDCVIANTDTPINAILKRDVPMRQHKVRFSDEDAIKPLLQIMRDESDLFDGGRFSIINGLFQALFWKCIRNFHVDVLEDCVIEDQKTENHMKLILNVFGKNLYEMPDIEQLCTQCNMSRSTLARFCHRFFEMPTERAYLSYKINYIKRILNLYPLMTLKEISTKFGFANQFHFSTLFKRFVGVSPQAYRQSPNNIG